MSEFTFLTEEQCYGSDKLNILEKRGTKAAISDFSILLGGFFEDSEHIDGNSSLEGRTGRYWTKSSDEDKNVFTVDEFGVSAIWINALWRDTGSRPALSFSSIDRIPTNGERGRRAKDGILEVEYGYYPQKAVSKNMQIRLEREYASGRIKKTGNGYTTDSRAYDDYDESFLAQRHAEYEYNGKRYVRVEANSYYEGTDVTLSNGEDYREGDNVWVEVLPVKWLVDERAKMMITEKLIFAGVQFDKAGYYRTSDFDKTNIKQFMDNYFAKELVQARGLESVDRNGEDSQGVTPRLIPLITLNYQTYPYGLSVFLNVVILICFKHGAKVK